VQQHNMMGALVHHSFECQMFKGLMNDVPVLPLCSCDAMMNGGWMLVPQHFMKLYQYAKNSLNLSHNKDVCTEDFPKIYLSS
jgi:hypothetical protein